MCSSDLQLFFAIGCRSERQTALEIGFFRNPALLAAIAISSLLQVAVVTLPFTRPVFEVQTDLGREWLLVFALALVPLAVVEAGKRLRLSRRPLDPPPASRRAAARSRRPAR